MAIRIDLLLLIFIYPLRLQRIDKQLCENVIWSADTYAKAEVVHPWWGDWGNRRMQPIRSHIEVYCFHIHQWHWCLRFKWHIKRRKIWPQNSVVHVLYRHLIPVRNMRYITILLYSLIMFPFLCLLQMKYELCEWTTANFFREKLNLSNTTCSYDFGQITSWNAYGIQKYFIQVGSHMHCPKFHFKITITQTFFEFI